MGLPMAELLVKAGHDVMCGTTAAKPSRCGSVARSSRASPTSPARTSCSRSSDWHLEEAHFAQRGAGANKAKLPPIFVDCSTIGVDESAAAPPAKRLGALGADYIAAPVSGMAKAIVAGRLSAVASGRRRPSARSSR